VFIQQQSHRYALCPRRNAGLFRGRPGADRIALDHSIFGPLPETFVFSELFEPASWFGKSCALYHYRDKDQEEVDLVIEAGVDIHPSGKPLRYFLTPFMYLLIGSTRALLIDTGDVADPGQMPGEHGDEFTAWGQLGQAPLAGGPHASTS
jgi:Domain of unknown function (DUF4143)